MSTPYPGTGSTSIPGAPYPTGPHPAAPGNGDSRAYGRAARPGWVPASTSGWAPGTQPSAPTWAPPPAPPPAATRPGQRGANGPAAPQPLSELDATRFADLFNSLVANIGHVLVGKSEAVRLCLICLFSEGHLLIEDVPGTGKTTLAKALAASIGGSTSRIQFTPDLLPSDVTGVTVFDQSKGVFEFHPGPVFASVVLADEINRASPKTQSALLEVMEEGAVTVDGVTRPVGNPFLVIGTQNPIEQAGTYRLPEAQLDRFLMRASLGHPGTEHAVDILADIGTRATRASVPPMVAGEAVAGLTYAASRVHVDPAVLRYIVRLVEGTRVADGVALGVSQRGAIALLRTAKTRAASYGRNYVLPDDVKELTVPVLAHRIGIDAEAEFNGLTAEAVLAQVVQHVPSPRSDD